MKPIGKIRNFFKQLFRTKRDRYLERIITLFRDGEIVAIETVGGAAFGVGIWHRFVVIIMRDANLLRDHDTWELGRGKVTPLVRDVQRMLSDDMMTRSLSFGLQDACDSGERSFTYKIPDKPFCLHRVFESVAYQHTTRRSRRRVRVGQYS